MLNLAIYLRLLLNGCLASFLASSALLISTPACNVLNKSYPFISLLK